MFLLCIITLTAVCPSLIDAALCPHLMHILRHCFDQRKQFFWQSHSIRINRKWLVRLFLHNRQSFDFSFKVGINRPHLNRGQNEVDSIVRGFVFPSYIFTFLDFFHLRRILKLHNSCNGHRKEKNCTLPLESPVSTPSDTCQRAPKPSKILTRHCVPSSADYSRIFPRFVIPCYQFAKINECRHPSFSPDFAANNNKNSGKCVPNTIFGTQKHRTSWAQTSVLSMPNIGTLWQRSPMFPVFRPENALKCPLSYFAIFQHDARRDGFRGPSRPINGVAWEGRDSGKRTLENIAHSSISYES